MALFLNIPVSELVTMKLPEKVQPQIFKGNAKPESWEEIDRNTLPLVKASIRQLQGAGLIRPKRITVYRIERMLNLPSRRITLHLPQCYAEIKQNEETKQEFWAREIVWAENIPKFV